MKVTVKRIASQEIAPSANSHPPTDLSGRQSLPRKKPRRMTKNSRAGVRLRRESLGSSSRRESRPETPLLTRKFNEGVSRNDDSVEDYEGGRTTVGRIRPALSARKLAAGLWRMRLPNPIQSFDLQNGGSDLVKKMDVYSVESSPNSVSGPRHGLLLKCPNSAMEGATKWDPDGWKLLKPVENRSPGATRIPSLEAGLNQAKTRINELEEERRSSKKKMEQLLCKINEEKVAWKSREHDKVRDFMNDMKVDLSTERKNRQKLEMINSKLVNELANVKLSAKRYVHEYEKERKARELTEEVCDELAKEIREDKAELEELKRESMNIWEEVEEERKMLQMAEVWREERVQMKLIDAKLMLEEKHSQMNQIIADLESFLRSIAPTADSGEMKKAQFLKHIAASVNMQDIRNLEYEPPNPDDIFSIFEDANIGGSQSKGGEQSFGHSPMSHTVSSVKKLSRECGQRRSDDIEDDTSEWETVSQAEDQGSSYSPYGSISRCRGEGSPIMEINEVENGKTRQTKKGFGMSKLWKSLSGGTISNGSMKGDIKSFELGEERSQIESENTQISGGKGCMENDSLKARLMEARMEKQKIQLRQVLQQKM